MWFQELEVNQMLEFLEKNEQSENKQMHSGFMGFLSKFFYASNLESTEKQQLLR